MACDLRTIAYLVEQAGGAAISARAMFGEYALYRDGRLVALVCDDRLFVKPTAPGRALASDAAEAPPYPGAKPCLLIDPERWDDAEWLTGLIAATAQALPPPKPKRKR